MKNFWYYLKQDLMSAADAILCLVAMAMVVLIIAFAVGGTIWAVQRITHSVGCATSTDCAVVLDTWSGFHACLCKGRDLREYAI